MEATYKVPKSNLAKLTQQIDRLNKRAAKLGCTPIQLDILRTFQETATEPVDSEEETTKALNSHAIIYECVEIKLTGTDPHYAGWTFIAAIQHLPSDDDKQMEVIRTVPGMEVPESLRHRGPICDHCHVKRYRIDTYIVKHDSGEYKQVGRTCLKDFLGHTDPHALAEYLSILFSAAQAAEDAEEYNGKAFHSNEYSYIALLPYLEDVACVIKVAGWTSRAAAQHSGLATADLASEIRDWRTLSPKVREIKKLINALTEQELQECVDTANAALEWAKQFYDASGNDYQQNIGSIAMAGILNYRMVGYAASIVSSYLNFKHKETEMQKIAATSNWVGAIKERREFTLKLTKVFVKEGAYGPTYIQTFQDDQGNCFVWFGSKLVVPFTEQDRYIEEQILVTFKATIKDHITNKFNVKQTVLTNVR